MFGVGFQELLIIGFILVLLFLTTRWILNEIRKPDKPNAEDRSARQILDERYASGEISRDEYERMRRDIGTGWPCPLSKRPLLW